MTFGPELAHILDAAQWEAARQGKLEADTGHLLLGLLHPPPSQTARVLASLGVQPKQERLSGLPTVSEDVWPPAVPIPVLPRRLARESEAALRLAQQEAEARGDVLLGPEHLVLGLLRGKQGLGAMLLYAHGLTAEKLRPLLLGTGARR